VAERFRTLHPGLRILFMSGYPAHAPSDPGVFRPDVAFLHKPFTAAGLLRKVRERLDAEQQVPA
jgi:two-component SAPR family response regulator